MEVFIIIVLVLGLIFVGLHFQTRRNAQQEPRERRKFLPSEEWISVRKWLLIIGITFLALKFLLPPTITIEIKHSGSVKVDVDDVTPSYNRNDNLKVRLDQTYPLQVQIK
jgi:hypothetical protein